MSCRIWRGHTYGLVFAWRTGWLVQLFLCLSGRTEVFIIWAVTAADLLA
jgi:hypothetical protein